MLFALLPENTETSIQAPATEDYEGETEQHATSLERKWNAADRTVTWAYGHADIEPTADETYEEEEASSHTVTSARASDSGEQGSCSLEGLVLDTI